MPKPMLSDPVTGPMKVQELVMPGEICLTRSAPGTNSVEHPINAVAETKSIVVRIIIQCPYSFGRNFQSF